LCVEDGGETRLVRIGDGAVLRRFPASGHCAFAEAGGQAVWVRAWTRDLENAVESFDARDGRRLVHVPLGAYPPEGARLSRGDGEGWSFLTVSLDHSVTRRVTATGAPLAVLPRQEGFLEVAEFTASNGALLTRSQNGRHLKVWQVDGGAAPLLQFRLDGHLAVDPVRDEIAVGRGTRLDVIGVGDILRPIPGGEDLGLHTVDARGGSALFVGPGRVRWVDVGDGRVVRDAAVTTADGKDPMAALGAGGRSMAVRDATGWRVWHADRAEAVALEGSAVDDHGVRGFFDRDRAFVVKEPNGDLHVWDTRTGARRARFRLGAAGEIFVVGLSDDAARYAVRAHEEVKGPDGRVELRTWIEVHDVASGRRLARYAAADVTTGIVGEFAFGPGDRLLRISEQGDLVVERLPDGRPVRRLTGFASFPSRPRMSPDGRRLFVEIGDALQVLDVEDGRPLAIQHGVFGPGATLLLDGDVAHAALVQPRGRHVLRLDLGLEDRPPAEVARRVACIVPLRVVAGRLVETEPPRACAGDPPAAPAGPRP
jgi:hypothetical protein